LEQFIEFTARSHGMAATMVLKEALLDLEARA
jgi:hypothetical protein